MPHGIYATVTHTGVTAAGILLNDIFPTTDGPTTYRRAGPVYVPVNGTIVLTYTDTVATSFESGAIRGFVNLGYLTASLTFGSSVVPIPAPPNGPAGGDLSGTYPNPSVVGFNGIPIDLNPPVNGDVLTYNNLTLQWEHSPIVGGGGPPVGPAGGDLGGIYPNPGVVGLQLDPLAPKIADGFIKRNAANNAWEEVAYGSVANTVCEGDDARLSDARTPTGAAGGDLSGTYPNPVVDGLQNRPVSNAAPATGAALVWDGVQWAPSTGGLTGSYTLVTVVANHNAAPWEIILADTSGGGFTVTLPLAATCTGKPITIKKISSDGNVLLVDAQGAEEIDGSPNLSITGQYVSPTVVSDGTNWWII
jgi:hypothetical protein